MTAAPTRSKRKPATVEHPRCDACGWTLFETFAGTLVCLHHVCVIRRRIQEPER